MSEQSTASSMPLPKTPDPKIPRLAQIPSFVEYMGTGWSTPDRTAPVEPGVAAAAASHRERLSASYVGTPIVVLAGRAPVRANDSFYLFRPDSDFFWLTGCDVEDAVVVMLPTAGGHDTTVYIPAPAYPGEPGFFADAVHGELWVGAAPGMPEWAEALQVTVKPLSALETDLRGVNGFELTGHTGSNHAAVNGIPVSATLGRTLAELRMIKDAWEIAELRRAVDATVGGFAEVLREVPNAIAGGGERWLQGTFDRYARTHGNGPGYSTIVGSGRHAPTLHWVRCDGPVLEDEVLLLDMGVETRAFYTADVTRTFPASGTFSPVQRQVHDLVEKSHRAGLDAVKPGRDFSDFHVAAMEVIATGLHDWGILPVSVDEALSPTGQQHRRYLVCGIGHHLGLDVHDCAQSSYEAYQGGSMTEGMVLTVEPGLYFHDFDQTLPPELRGIGVRLEDDVVVTATGSEVISDAMPIDAAGVEWWMREQQAAPAGP
ncbi:aminopeptidase P family protein [Lysinibacter cavernae]|uniref:Xaa-Pro aminopeptidase n=1 Tax=Lysinibacter cavernae TaxID=1640652 RepID=A0A7X5QYQ4_9MICO|nr:aminopeptidase P family protein [Lysinibacter cavernae]NIH52310.1 Xaa-Pro aminopeptidase [Lysinibacter cavernae]